MTILRTVIIGALGLTMTPIWLLLAIAIVAQAHIGELLDFPYRIHSVCLLFNIIRIYML